MATIVEREATISREKLDGVEAESNHSTHVLLNFENRSRPDNTHMYMNVSPSHT